MDLIDKLGDDCLILRNLTGNIGDFVGNLCGSWVVSDSCLHSFNNTLHKMSVALCIGSFFKCCVREFSILVMSTTEVNFERNPCLLSLR